MPGGSLVDRAGSVGRHRVRLSRVLSQTRGFRISWQFIRFCFLFVFIFIVNIRYSQRFNNTYVSVKPVTLAKGHDDATDTCLVLDHEVVFKFFLCEVSFIVIFLQMKNLGQARCPHHDAFNPDTAKGPNHCAYCLDVI